MSRVKLRILTFEKGRKNKDSLFLDQIENIQFGLVEAGDFDALTCFFRTYFANCVGNDGIGCIYCVLGIFGNVFGIDLDRMLDHNLKTQNVQINSRKRKFSTKIEIK
jgi:hypothetical protein